MAITASLYSQLPYLVGAGLINKSNLRTKLLNGSTFDASHTTIDQVDGGSKAVVTITIASPGVVTHTAHGKSNGQAVLLNSTGALPTGLVNGNVYYIINAATNTYQLSATVGGSAINTSGSQSGVHTAFYSGSQDAGANGWPPFGPLVTTPTWTQAAITDATVNDASFDADDVEQSASGGSIGPATAACLYDSITGRTLEYVDFGTTYTAGDTTSFKIRWNVAGLFDITQ